MSELQLQGYQEWLLTLKDRIKTAQTQAALAVNSELILLYWQIGQDISERQMRHGWGAGVVPQLSNDLKKEFPKIKGFSARNLGYMKALAEAWPDKAILQQLAAKLPWGHNMLLLDRLNSATDRGWYVKATIEGGWSRAVLAHQIDTRLHERQGSAITNFHRTLPAPQSEVAHQILKNPYMLGFLELAQGAVERDLENGLTENLKEFLLELGKGFAYIGRQYPLVVGGQDFFLDLLFYNTKLHCYVVIDLKMEDFKPEYVGKMQFYLSAVDAQLKTDRDDPSIGIILCKTKNGVIAEFALKDSTKPIGVSEYKVLPAKLAQNLPTAEQLEEVLTRPELQDTSGQEDSELD